MESPGTQLVGVAFAAVLIGCSGSFVPMPPQPAEAGAEAGGTRDAGALQGAGQGGASTGDAGSAGSADAGQPDGADGGTTSADAGEDGGTEMLCQPRAASCDGDAVQLCNDAGSGFTITELCVPPRLCIGGACRLELCQANATFCSTGGVWSCNGDGTSSALTTPCADGQACDGASVHCAPRTCEPGTLECDGADVETCNGSGTAWVTSVPNCGAQHAICIAGACKPIVCVPGAATCQSDKAYRCSADGTSSVLEDACPAASQHCIQSDATNAYCAYWVCQPNAPFCIGNTLATCDTYGLGWLPGETDCAKSNAACINGACVPKVCSPAIPFCSAGNVQQCDNFGTSSSLSKVCGAGSYCSPYAFTFGADCIPTLCLAGGGACDGERYAQCAADGMSVAPGGTDCSAAHQVCTTQGCAASASDTLGTAGLQNPDQPNRAVLNVMQVVTTRELTAIDVYLSLSSPATLYWIIYQQSLANAQFVPVFQTTTSGSGVGFQSSGPIAFELDANRTYAIGAGASTAFSYSTSPLTGPLSLGFASLMGSAFFSAPVRGNWVTTSFGANLVYSRLTTTAP